MKIYLFVIDDLYDSKIIDFFAQFKKLKFIFKEFSNIRLLYDQRKLVMLNENTSLTDFNKTFKKNTSFFSINTCFLLPKNYFKASLNIKPNIIHYPITLFDFEKNLLTAFRHQKILFKNLELRNDSILFNKNNNQYTHLTEIESKIVLLLFNNEKVDKKTLNMKVLNQSPLIESKSLESHLYRLRKKLIGVDSKKKIVLINKQSLKII